MDSLLLDDGSISEQSYKKFFQAVKAFFIDATTQALRKLPFNDPLLNSAKFLNFDSRETTSFEFFCNKYSNILEFNSSQIDRLQEQFIDYQLMDKADIPETVWEKAMIAETDERKYYIEWMKFGVTSEILKMLIVPLAFLSCLR